MNNQRIKQQKLSAGDHVVIGPVVFTVQIDGDPKEIHPVKTTLRTRPGKRAPKAEAKATADVDEEFDPISALEALASSADQTALEPLDDEEEELE